VKRTPFRPEETARLKQFCQERLFDLDYYPGITAEEPNRFTRLSRPYYFETAREILAGEERRAAFLRDYPFNLAPATDDRPYFNHFFRWRTLPLLLRTYGRQGFPLLEWGYLILVATLLQAALLSFVLILLPLLLRRQAPSPASQTRGGPSRWRILLFFLAIGLGYLLIEIVLIQKFTFFLANPIYAVAVVLSGVLGFSGLGSLVTGWLSPQVRLRGAGLPLACGGVAVLSLAAAFLLPLLLPVWVGLGSTQRVGVSLLLLAPPAFLMGMPFPLAWQRLEIARPNLLPWAWGVNGCASVLAAILATLLAMSFGFRFVLGAAAVLYLGAAAAAYPPWTIRQP
jgi:hypothetical protein